MQIEIVMKTLHKGADEDFDPAVLMEGAFKSEGEAHKVRVILERKMGTTDFTD
jgi:hypothetical protein